MSDSTAALLARLKAATAFFALVVVVGTISFYSVGGGQWSWFDCFYMTLITLSTVGYGEVLHGMEKLVEARVVAVTLIVVGSGTLVYFVSTITAFIVEGDLQGILRRRRMDRNIDGLTGHAIVCGAGATGRHVISELVRAKHPVVVVDRNRQVVAELEGDLGVELLHVVGSAIDDHVLARAGIERASIVVAALTDDTDNLFVTITARAFNGAARIVAKCVEPTTERKLLRAGATSVVSPNYIGGMRMAGEVLRPNAVAFLDRLLRDQGDRRFRIEELSLPEGNRLVGKTLAETELRNQGALVIAVRLPGGEFVYNPAGDQRLEVGSALVVLAELDDVRRLRGELQRHTLI